MSISILVVVVMFGAGLIAATFAIAIKPAAGHTCDEVDCITEGRMTGGGRLATSMIVTHGFELHCDVNDLPNNLQINWDGGNKFHLESLTDVRCFDSPGISAGQPRSDFDRMEGSGIGTYNGQDAARITFVLTDAGEPGKNDFARFRINFDGSTVLNVNGKLDVGNHQAH